ncbi:MAG: hypothetical protein ACWA5T_01655 [Parvularcula sp.]
MIVKILRVIIAISVLGLFVFFVIRGTAPQPEQPQPEQPLPDAESSAPEATAP